ncbi:hypothetical protein C0993_008429 [Termitomyces sp. T159_Od127]|nr:hypothetical protein C0993_008429 [Termitomyces sp. T159_Od127]
MALFPDTSLAHLPSQSSQTLLLCTTLPHFSTPVNTLVDSSATNNFIDKSLATLATTPQKLPLSIYFTLFNGSSTSTDDITHYVQTTLTFANSQWQDLQLLVTCLHTFAPLILGLPWLRSTNPHVGWQNLTIHFDCQTLEHPEPISFDVTALVSTTDHPHTPPQLCLKFTWSFILNAQLGKSSQVLTALINSRATETFVSDQLNFTHDLLNRPMELQLFDSKPTTAGPITKTHTSSIILNDSLWFLVHLLVTQFSKVTPIVLGLLWLCNLNSNIDWKDLTMKFPEPSACLAAVNLRLQLTDDPSKAGATSAPTTLLDNSGKFPPPRHTLGAPLAFPPNILHNKYKGPKYPTHRPWTMQISPLNPLTWTPSISKSLAWLLLLASSKMASLPSSFTSLRHSQKNI